MTIGAALGVSSQTAQADDQSRWWREQGALGVWSPIAQASPFIDATTELEATDQTPESAPEDGFRFDAAAQTPEAAAEPAAFTLKTGASLTLPLEGRLEDYEFEVDGFLLSGLATLQDGVLTLEPPFEKPGRHVLLVRTLAGQEVARVPFDILPRRPELAFSYTADASASTTGAIVTRSTAQLEKNSETHTQTFDGAASATVSAVRGAWSLETSANALAAESVERSSFPERRWDFSNVRGTLAYRPEDAGAGGEVSVGDVDVSGDNAFVHSGFSGRGVAVSAFALDERIRFSSGFLSGDTPIGYLSEIQEPDDDEFRFGAQIDAALIEEGPITLALGLTAFHGERSLFFGFDDSSVDNAETNTAFGAKIGVGFFEDQLRYTGEFGRSTYGAPATVGSDVVFETETAYGQAHLLEFDAPLEEDTISFLTGYERTEPFFQGFEGGFSSDSESFKVGADSSFGAFGLGGEVSVTRDNLDKVAEQLRTRVLSVSGYASYSFDDEIFDIPLWPDAVNFSADFIRNDTLDVDAYLAATGFELSDAPFSSERTFGADVSWSYELTDATLADTSVSYSRTFNDERTFEFEDADTVDNSVSFSQSFSGDWWSFSGDTSFNFGRQFDPEIDGSTLGIDFSIAASLTPEIWPHLSVSLQRSVFNTNLDAEDFSETTRDITAVFDLSFTPLLTRFGLPEGVQASIQYERTRSETEGDSFSALDFDDRVFFTFGAAL